MLSNKALKKIQDILSTEVIAEMNETSTEELKTQIIISETVMKDAKQELEENPKYQETKQILKDVSQSFKEVKKFQTARIAYALDLLESKGK